MVVFGNKGFLFQVFNYGDNLLEYDRIRLIGKFLCWGERKYIDGKKRESQIF